MQSKQQVLSALVGHKVSVSPVAPFQIITGHRYDSTLIVWVSNDLVCIEGWQAGAGKRYLSIDYIAEIIHAT
jgi:hypothetical protein